MAVQFPSLISVVFLLVVVGSANAQGSSLKLGYYKYSCPNAETIIQQVTQQFVKQDPTLAPALLRFNFHDCFVRGCDASVLLLPTKANNQTELTSIPNLTLRAAALNVIDAIKTKLEKSCPGIVSCADIVTLAARDAIQVINGPWWYVPTGRRDGTISVAFEALVNLPPPFANITTLIQNFAAKGLNIKDLVVLSGSHTIGVGHCATIQSRLYNFTGKGDTDPSLDPSYAAWLKKTCKPNPKDITTIVGMDTISPSKFDVGYYVTVAQHRGLFQSDAALLNDKYTKNYIYSQINPNYRSTFNVDFANSMVKMNQIGVLTGSQGQIRKKCGFVN